MSQFVSGTCWVCRVRHKTSDFPSVQGVPITYGYMGRDCREIYNNLPPEKQARIRADGIARYEAERGTRVT